MAGHKVIQGAVNDARKDFVRTDQPLGTEQLVSVCAAGEMAILIDKGVDLSDSQEIRVTLHDMIDFWMDNEFIET